jgi:stearoyl-CoA 9-desaturase NADPH oxidoreductase
MKAAMVWHRLAGLVATPLAPSHYVALFRPLARGRARIEAVTRETPTVVTLTLQPGAWAGHVPGQHVRVGIELDGRIATRCYSISSAAGRRDGCFTITVKAQGRVSNALTAAAPGHTVTVSEPTGEFVLPSESRLLFITGGSGITPIASMLRTYANGAMPDVEHVHFARSPDEVIFGDELAALAAAHPTYRRHVFITGDTAPSRRLDRALLDDRVPDWATRTTLACGPTPLLEAAAFASPRVERFGVHLAPPADAIGGRVRFRTSGRSAISDGRTPLLRLAEDTGIAAPHGCRMGICHSCDVTLTAGCVRDLRTGHRIDEPGARIQTCVCAAAGDVELAL